MDHFGKALEQAREQDAVKNWVRPASTAAALPAIDDVSSIDQIELPKDILKENHILCGNEEDAALSDKFRRLRTQLSLKMTAKKYDSIGITSAGPKDGKTFTAINLAITLGRNSNGPVILIDADLRRPSIATRLGLNIERGFCDYLSETSTLEETLIRTDAENLVILPGREYENPHVVPDLLHSGRMSTIIQSLRSSLHPSTIIVDLPPVLVGDDVIATSPRLDALALVVNEGGTQREDLEKTIELLANFDLLGTILNRSRERASSADDSYYDHRSTIQK